MSTDVLASLNVCHNCLQCCIRCQFSVVFIVTLSLSSSCRYHGFRHTTTFHRSYSPISPRFVYFLPQMRHTVRFSIVISAVVNTSSVLCVFITTITTVVDVVCILVFIVFVAALSLSCVSLLPCSPCNVVIVCVMRCYVFISICTAIDPLFCPFVLLYVVTRQQYASSTRHMLSLLHVVTFYGCLC